MNRETGKDRQRRRRRRRKEGVVREMKRTRSELAIDRVQ